MADYLANIQQSRDPHPSTNHYSTPGPVGNTPKPSQQHEDPMEKYNETATMLNEMQDLRNYLIEAVRDIDALDEDTCTQA